MLQAWTLAEKGDLDGASKECELKLVEVVIRDICPTNPEKFNLHLVLVIITFIII